MPDITQFRPEKIPTDATLKQMAESNDRLTASIDRNTAAMQKVQELPGQLVAASKEIRQEVVGGAKDVTKDAGSWAIWIMIAWWVIKLIALYLGKKWMIRP